MASRKILDLWFTYVVVFCTKVLLSIRRTLRSCGESGKSIISLTETSMGKFIQGE